MNKHTYKGWQTIRWNLWYNKFETKSVDWLGINFYWTRLNIQVKLDYFLSTKKKFHEAYPSARGRNRRYWSSLEIHYKSFMLTLGFNSNDINWIPKIRWPKHRPAEELNKDLDNWADEQLEAIELGRDYAKWDK